MEYTGIVCKATVRSHPNADRLQIANVCNVDVIVGLDTVTDDLGVYFASDGQLSVEFCEANNLIGKVDPETGIKSGGYFGKNRRVKAQTFRGTKSHGFWIPIKSLNFIPSTLPAEEHFKDGDEISQIGKIPICNKYITPATMQAMQGKKGGRNASRVNNHFAKHIDTKHLVKFLKYIPHNSLIYFTEKVHGTSGRTGYVIDDTEYKRSIASTIFRGMTFRGFKRNYTIRDYDLLTGTRNVILKKYTRPGFYGNEDFRSICEQKYFAGKLKKGEIIYYEIVGFTTTGKSIMPCVEVNDKAIKKLYGKQMVYNYGEKINECGIYVYRITNVNDDGIAVDLSWLQVLERCMNLGVHPVPNLDYQICAQSSPDHFQVHPYFYNGDTEILLRIVEELCHGTSTLDGSHMREGVVIRVESKAGMYVYKHKSHEFLVLEGIAKDSDNYVDTEEIC